MAIKTKVKKKRSIAIPDLSRVSGKFETLEEGTYLMAIVDVTEEEGANSGVSYLNWELEVAEGDSKSSKAWFVTSLGEKSLWNLRGWLEALGVEIPESASEIDVEDLVGMTINVDIEHEEYEGKTRARIVDYHSAGEASEEKEEAPEVEDDEKKKDKEEEVEGYTEEQVNDMSIKELEALIKEHELEVDLDEHRSQKKKQAAVMEALEEKGLLVEEAGE